LGGGSERRLVIADIPGLIAGAAAGAGLGHEFLRHIERTTALVHLLDIAPADGSDPVDSYKAIRGELVDYSPELAAKPEIVAFNKIDLVPDIDRRAVVERTVAAIGGSGPGKPLVISGATGEGLKELLEACWHAAEKSDPSGWQAR